MTGQIIILHGPSSAGKSTLALALQDAIDLPFWHLSIDHLRDAGILPMVRIDRNDFRWSDLRAQVFDGFHASLAAYLAAGNNLILEHILDSPEWVDDLKRILCPYDVVFVGLHCDLAELQRRERERGDRAEGSAERDFHAVHANRVYDVEIDAEASIAQNVALVLAVRRSGIRTSEFAHRQADGPSGRGRVSP